MEQQQEKKNTEVREKGDMLLLFLIRLHALLVCPRVIHMYGERESLSLLSLFSFPCPLPSH